MKEIDLPSGAKLKLGVVPFEFSKALFQAILEEAKALSLASSMEMADVYKSLFCIGFSSKKIEACLWKCFEKVIYEDKRGPLKIDKDTFEPVENRGDYMAVCLAVTKDNIDPFVKGLYAGYREFLAAITANLV